MINLCIVVRSSTLFRQYRSPERYILNWGFRIQDFVGFSASLKPELFIIVYDEADLYVMLRSSFGLFLFADLLHKLYGQELYGQELHGQEIGKNGRAGRSDENDPNDDNGNDLRCVRNPN